MPFFVIFRRVRDILRVTVAFDHPVVHVADIIDISYDIERLNMHPYHQSPI